MGAYVLIYLASPYSHPDPAVRKQRFEDVCRCAAKLILQGQVVFCPIAHSHPIELLMEDARFSEDIGWDFWSKQDIPFMERCDRFVVV